MSKFLFVYHGGGAPSSPEEAEKAMSLWTVWMSGLGAALIDGGAPVGKSSTVNADGSVTADGGANPVSGYSLVEADDLAAAQAFAKDCPILKDGGTIEIAETFEP